MRVDDLPQFAQDRITLSPTGCWSWTGSIDRHGYGHWGDYLAHRRVFGLFAALPEWGTSAESLELDHLCRNRRCVNPDHMELVTRRENGIRGVGTVSARNLAATHCPHGHELTGANLVRSRLPHRQCRACHLEHQRRWRESRRAEVVAS